MDLVGFANEQFIGGNFLNSEIIIVEVLVSVFKRSWNIAPKSAELFCNLFNLLARNSMIVMFLCLLVRENFR